MDFIIFVQYANKKYSFSNNCKNIFNKLKRRMKIYVKAK